MFGGNPAFQPAMKPEWERLEAELLTHREIELIKQIQCERNVAASHTGHFIFIILTRTM